MSYLKRMLVMQVRHSKHTLYLFFVVLFCALFGTVANYFQTITESYQDLSARKSGYELSLTRLDGEDIPAGLLEELAAMEGVAGLNECSYQLVMPVSFQNEVPPQENDAFEMEPQPEVKLYGDRDVRVEPAFYTNGVLTEGEFPSRERPGVVIDGYLARQNGLGLGDELTLQEEGNDQPATLEIVGIYERLGTITEARLVNDEEVNVPSPYSYLFADLKSYEGVIGSPVEDGSQIDICAWNLKTLKRVEKTLRASDLLSDQYELVNSTELRLGTIESAIAVSNSALLVSMITAVTATVILIAVILLWMRDKLRESAILLSLGQSKFGTVGQYLLITAAIALAAIAVASPLCVLLADLFGESMVRTVFEAAAVLKNGNLIGSDADISQALGETLTLGGSLAYNLRYLLIAELSALLASAEILGQNPRKLFHAR